MNTKISQLKDLYKSKLGAIERYEKAAAELSAAETELLKDLGDDAVKPEPAVLTIAPKKKAARVYLHTYAPETVEAMCKYKIAFPRATLSELAQQFGMKPEACRVFLSRAGIKTSKAVLTEEQEREITQAFVAGVTKDELAKKWTTAYKAMGGAHSCLSPSDIERIVQRRLEKDTAPGSTAAQSSQTAAA